VRAETLHAPHGREMDPWVCPKCFHPFEALFLYIRHIREAHQEKRGLA
jgi:uncharacterized C2H2 Zn-finger protein